MPPEAEVIDTDPFVENAPDAILIYDLNGRILAANRVACEKLGYSPGELTGRWMAEVDGSYDATVFLSRHSQMVLGAPVAVQGILRSKDGTTLSVDLKVSLLNKEGRSLFLAIARETLELRRGEDDQRQSQKMEALGRLAGGVAHDFNNLLTAILGYSDLILSSVGPGFGFQNELVEVKRAGERAAELTRQLLAFSRRQPSRPRVLDLGSLVKGIEGMLRRLIPESIRLEFGIGPEGLFIRADPGQIDQITMNLALNARDAMPQGGVLRITIAATEVTPAFSVKHPGCTPGTYALLSVSDTGVGIPKEQLSHLFEPFFTTKVAGKGTGLGLATVYGITKQSGGFLAVSSEPGKGSTFRVYLPSVQDRPRTASDSQVLPSFSGNERILLVEDDASVRAFVAQSLRSHGYAVTALPGPREATQLPTESPAPDLLLTDMVMPEMNGRELAQELRARYPGIRVVYMSGYTEDTAVREGRVEPGADFIAKPFVIANLLSRIRKTLLRTVRAAAPPNREPDLP